MQNRINKIQSLSTELLNELQNVIVDVNPNADKDSITIPLNITLAEMELLIIKKTLALHNNNQSETAKALGIGRVTLYRHLKE